MQFPRDASEQHEGGAHRLRGERHALVTLMPFALLVLLVLLLARLLARRQIRARFESSRYEWLGRIADLRDRGVLTEEEFEREKRRLLQ